MTVTAQEPGVGVDAWGSFAQKYEKGTGGATRYIATRLVELSPPFTNDSVILDNACGPGIVTEEVQKSLKAESDLAVKVYAADAAPPMVQLFNAKADQAKANGTWPNIADIAIHSIPAEKLDESFVPSGSITHSYMNFGLFFCTDPIQAARHIYRTLAPGGTAFVTSWADLGYMDAMRKTEQVCNPSNADFKMPFTKEWEDPGHAKHVLSQAGFPEANIKTFQEVSFFRAKDVDELVGLHTDLFGNLIRGPAGFGSDESKKEWARQLTEYTVHEKSFVQEENGVATRMLANIAVCTK